MATIAQNISRIQTAKADLKTAIEAKGVTVPSATTIDGYAALVEQIQTGGGSASADLVNLIERDITSINIPNTVTTIGQNAFSFCTSLTSVTIGSGVTTIGNGAFNYCTGLTSISIPNNVTTINENAFYSCSGLTSIEIPNSVTSIGQYAFYHCIGLTSVTIGNGVTSIGGNVFDTCSSLSSVTVLATTPPTLGSGAFGSNASGRKIYVPAASVAAYKAASGWSTYANNIYPIPITIVSKIDVKNAYDETIICNDTSNFNAIEIDGVVQPSVVSTYEFPTSGEHTIKYVCKNNYLSGGPFANCYYTTEFIIPNDITDLGSDTFNMCISLTSVTVQATTPPTLGSGAFDGNASDRKIYVPAASVNAYKAASGWSSYASDIEAIQS